MLVVAHPLKIKNAKSEAADMDVFSILVTQLGINGQEVSLCGVNIGGGVL